MVISEAERKRLYRQKQREIERATIKETKKIPEYLSRPFSEFFKEREFYMFEENLDAFGIQITGADILATEPQIFYSEYTHEAPVSSLQRAVGMVETLIDSAKELAELINAYKIQELEKAIPRALETNMKLPRDDIEALKKSISEIDKLKAIQADLRKPTRHTMHSTRSPHEI